MDEKTVKKYVAIVYDWDGTLAFGNELTPWAKELVKNVEPEKRYIITNSSHRTAQDILNVLQQAGIEWKAEHIITGTTIVKEYMKEQGYKHVYIIGRKSEGLKSVHNEETFDAFLITYDLSLPYNITKHVKNNKDKEVFALDESIFFPHQHGWAPGTGWLVRVIEHEINKKVNIIGKPYKFAFTVLQQRINDEGKVLMVGDSVADRIFALNNNLSFKKVGP